MSGLLLISFESMQKTIKALNESGVRDGVKIIIGGGVTGEIWKDKLGVDAWAPDAASGVMVCKELLREVSGL